MRQTVQGETPTRSSQIVADCICMRVGSTWVVYAHSECVPIQPEKNHTIDTGAKVAAAGACPASCRWRVR